MGDRRKHALRVQFDGKLRLEFQGAKINYLLTHPVGRRLDCAFDGRVSVGGQMSPRRVIVLKVRSQDAPQATFVENDTLIQALAPD